MTALDWYIVFAIGFTIFALWVAYEAEAALKRLRKKAREEASCESAKACSCSGEKGGKQ